MVVVEGFGLHTGAPARVVIGRQGSPGITLGVSGERASIDELSVVSTDRATTVQGRDGRVRVATVEHAFAALAGMSLHDGIAIDVEGPEMPLLDGGAATWCDAFAAIGVLPTRRRLRVTRAAVLHVGDSRYEFAPGDRVANRRARRIRRSAHRRGRALGGRGGRLSRARRRRADLRVRARRRRLRAPWPRPSGPARRRRPHFADGDPLRRASVFAERARDGKLLDLLGDWFLHGGPATGHLHAFRPGHASNRLAFARARQEGVLALV